jgi:hypothetical protein
VAILGWCSPHFFASSNPFHLEKPFEQSKETPQTQKIEKEGMCGRNLQKS